MLVYQRVTRKHQNPGTPQKHGSQNARIIESLSYFREDHINTAYIFAIPIFSGISYISQL